MVLGQCFTFRSTSVCLFLCNCQEAEHVNTFRSRLKTELFCVARQNSTRLVIATKRLRFACDAVDMINLFGVFTVDVTVGHPRSC